MYSNHPIGNMSLSKLSFSKNFVFGCLFSRRTLIYGLGGFAALVLWEKFGKDVGTQILPSNGIKFLAEKSNDGFAYLGQKYALVMSYCPPINLRGFGTAISDILGPSFDLLVSPVASTWNGFHAYATDQKNKRTIYLLGLGLLFTILGAGTLQYTHGTFDGLIKWCRDATKGGLIDYVSSEPK